MPSTTSSPAEAQPLQAQQCQTIHSGTAALKGHDVMSWLQQLPQWHGSTDGRQIYREFHFRDFHQTMAFVNAVARIAHQQDHHPEMLVSYNHAMIRYSTHAVSGLSLNDFICAAKIDALHTPTQ